MAIDFPNSPATNDTYTVGNKTWIYDGTTWNTYNSTSFSAETLPGTTLKSTVTGSSLTSVGTLTSLNVTGDLTVDTNTLKVDATNNRVGVGTASPQYALDVQSSQTLGMRVTHTGAGNAFLVEDSATTDSTPFVIDAAGKVGIGTSSPAEVLDVRGAIMARATTTSDGVQIVGSGNGSSTYHVTILPASLTGFRTLTLPDATGTVALSSEVTSDGIGYASGAYYTGFTTGLSGSIAFTTNTVYYSPFFVTQATTFDRIAVRGGTSMTGTATVRLGIYTNLNGKPTTLLNDYGTVSLSASVTGEVVISKLLQRGWYWLAAAPQASTGNNAIMAANPLQATFNLRIAPSFTALNYAGWQQTGVTGAFTTAGTLTELYQGIAIMLRST